MIDKTRLLRLLEDYGGDLMSFALSLVGNRAEAEDACQEMVVQMLKHWDQIDWNRNLKSWAFTILYRKCLDQLKKRRRFLKFLNQAAADYSATIEDRSGNRLEESISQVLLGRLRPIERTCLFLWAREGYSSEEIAGILGCSPGTVRVHLFQARKKLKKMMERGNAKKAPVSSG
ncbi:MAG: RNA polymerase sigma factor [Candidatus Saccharicenans sp.]|uniref:RNA polymerase sigma factor n=1 Tax=Candidatus Saccharicenans sp. TaxID=2819258 RepID=UPI00404909EF